MGPPGPWAMDYDLFFAVGTVLLVLAFPAVVGAFAHGRPPRAAAILVMVGGTLAGLAVSERPGVYTFEEAPAVFGRVVSHYL